MGTKVLRSDGSPGWKCIYCRHVLPSVSSTSNQRYHLRRIHKITDPEDHANDQQTTLDTHILRPFRVDVARKLLSIAAIPRIQVIPRCGSISGYSGFSVRL